MSNYLRNILELEQSIKRMQARLAILKLKAKQDMLCQGLVSQTIEGLGEVKLVKKRGKPSANTKQSQLAEQLELERNELMSINAEKLYSIQSEIGKLQLEEQNLLANEWTKELEAKIASEKTGKVAELESARLTISVKPAKLEAKPPAGFHQLVSELSSEIKADNLPKLTAKSVNELAIACTDEPNWQELVQIRFTMHKNYWTNS